MAGVSKSKAWTEFRQLPDAIDRVCDRLKAGEYQIAIARSLGTGVSTLWDWINADPERSARARDARIASASAESDLALQVLEDAKDPFELARAREIAQHRRWRARVADPRTYGDKLELGGEVGVRALPTEVLTSEVARLAERLGAETPADLDAQRDTLTPAPHLAIIDQTRR